MKKNILIIDDYEAIREAIKSILEAQGFSVSVLESGENLMQNLIDLPDLILLDMWMPKINGQEVCQQLKNQALTQTIPVIVMSAETDIVTKAKAFGADGCLAKPFALEELLSTIDHFIK